MKTQPHGSPALSRPAEARNRWTPEKPTIPGWYWIRTSASYEIVRVVKVDVDNPDMCALLVPIEPGGQGETVDLKDMDVEWHGPVGIPVTSSACVAA
jgi:hypothetical protein